MRILMLTDDVVIDRRIIQEAQTLIEAGHEVILLAAGSETLTEFELIGQVKVERIWRYLIPPTSGSLLIKSLIGTTMPFVSTVRTLFSAVRSFVARTAIVPKRLISLVFWRAPRFLVVRAAIGIRAIISLVRILARALFRRSTLLPLELAIVERVRKYDPDVIHAHDLPRLRVAVYSKRRFGLPVIYDAHELYPEINTITWSQKEILSRLEKHLIHRCDQVITVNPFIAKEMAERYNIAEPLVVYNAVNRPEGFDPTIAPNRFRKTMSIPADHAVLLYQGWMSKTRGLQELVRAMSLIDDGIHLVMMGYGEARDELEQIVREKNLGERVHFKEAVSQAELLYWTASADAGIIPYQPVDLNNYYSSPNKLFEFIQAGLPLIVNNLPFLKKVVGGENFGVVAKLETPEQYAQAIREMFDASQGGPGRFRQRLLEQASEYNWTKEEKKIIAIYRQFELKQSDQPA